MWLELLLANPDLPEALIHEVPVGRRGDVEEAVGLGLEGGEFRLDRANLLHRIRRLRQDFLGNELPEVLKSIMRTRGLLAQSRFEKKSSVVGTGESEWLGTCEAFLKEETNRLNNWADSINGAVEEWRGLVERMNLLSIKLESYHVKSVSSDLQLRAGESEKLLKRILLSWGEYENEVERKGKQGRIGA